MAEKSEERTENSRISWKWTLTVAKVVKIKVILLKEDFKTSRAKRNF